MRCIGICGFLGGHKVFEVWNTKYHIETLKHKTIQAYATYLNHTQIKGNKFIHPPSLKITNLKISTQECNPDRDILVNKPTIQIQDLESHIYDQDGNYMATITTNRLHWLWNRYSHNNLPHLSNFLQHPPQDFETEILWLIQRYITILPKEKPKSILLDNNHHTLHPDITILLINSFKITHSYYSSPLTCPIQLTQYNSPHNWDIIFGSLGQTKSSRWNEVGLAYPTNQNTALEAIH